MPEQTWPLTITDRHVTPRVTRKRPAKKGARIAQLATLLGWLGATGAFVYVIQNFQAAVSLPTLLAMALCSAWVSGILIKITAKLLISFLLWLLKVSLWIIVFGGGLWLLFMRFFNT